MKNIEKYEDQIKAELKKNNTLGCVVSKLMGNKCDDFPRCNACYLKVLDWLLQEYEEPKSILAEKEKIIINNILKAVEPFGAEVQCIAKYRHGDEPTDYYLNFSYKNSNDSFDTFTFNGNELFVGMEVDELYTLEELGL